MKLNLFSKERTSKEGRTFRNYFATITNKNGISEVATIKFAKIDPPKSTPCVIEFDKKNANLVTSTYVKDDDTQVTTRTIWVSEYIESEYIDTSLDDYE